MIVVKFARSEIGSAKWTVWFLLLSSTIFFSACSQIGQQPGRSWDGPATSRPYKLFGVTYYPLQSAEGFVEEGIASWYGEKFHEKPTAMGEIYDMHAISAAHKTLPLPTWVRVTNLDNLRSMVLRVNDRGPFVGDRVIDLSYGAAQVLGFVNQGTAHVRIVALGPAERRQAMAQAKVARKSSQAIKSLPRPPLVGKSLEPVAVSQAAVKQIAPQPQPQQSTPEPQLQTPTPESVNNRGLAAGLYVQAGSFLDFNNAKKLRTRLQGVGKSQILSNKVNNRTFYRVLFGPFPSPSWADNIVKSLQNSGVSAPRLVTQ